MKNVIWVSYHPNEFSIEYGLLTTIHKGIYNSCLVERPILEKYFPNQYEDANYSREMALSYYRSSMISNVKPNNESIPKLANDYDISSIPSIDDLPYLKIQLKRVNSYELVIVASDVFSFYDLESKEYGQFFRLK